VKAQKMVVAVSARLLASPHARPAVALQISLARTQISKTCWSCERRLYGGVFYHVPESGMFGTND